MGRKTKRNGKLLKSICVSYISAQALIYTRRMVHPVAKGLVGVKRRIERVPGVLALWGDPETAPDAHWSEEWARCSDSDRRRSPPATSGGASHTDGHGNSVHSNPDPAQRVVCSRLRPTDFVTH